MPVRSDLPVIRGAVAASRARLVDADEARRTGHQIAHEDAAVRVGIAGHQVRGTAQKNHVASVGSDHRAGRTGVAAAASGAIDADQGGRAGLEVAHEYVGGVVVVAGHQVACEALKSDIAAVGADHHIRR